MIGVGIVLGLVGCATIAGAGLGPCGLANAAGAVMMLAFVPGYLLISWLPMGEHYAWLQSALFFPAQIAAYSIPSWIFLALYRRPKKPPY